MNLAQVLVNKIHDIWIDFHEYVLLDSLMLDPSSLSAESRKKLVDLFDRIRLQRFENLAEQYLEHSSLKEKIDRGILAALGASKS